MFRRLAFGLCAVGCLISSDASAAVRRGLLWRVVQACVSNHRLTGSAFPCLAVDDGADGYAVVRAPFQKTHVIVTPTIRTIGVEADRLRGADAPNYFEDAWASRHFVGEALGHRLARDDLGLAVNSRAGRSQDQLHIHVDCLDPDVAASLSRQMPNLHSQKWVRIRVLPRAPRYWALKLARSDLTGTNVVDLVAKGLAIDADGMDQTTIVLAGAQNVDGKPGFVLLARQRIQDSLDEAHGEALLDNDCGQFATTER